MMKSDNCNCKHHVVAQIMVVLTWVSAILFFWSSLGTRTFWGFDAGYWAWTVIIFAVLARSMKCKCCCGGKHCQTCSIDTSKGM